jgi:hypothetical protein
MGVGKEQQGGRSRRGKCLCNLHIDDCSLVRERSGHLPIMMSVLCCLMEMVQDVPHQKRICLRNTKAQHSKNEIPAGVSSWN